MNIHDVFRYSSALHTHGFLLIRDPENTLDTFIEVTNRLGEAYDAHTVAQRRHVGDPDDHVYHTPRGGRGINLHSEAHYNPDWPRYVALFCAVPPTVGGETLVMDGRALALHLPEWNDVRIRYPWPHDHTMPVVNNGAWSTTLLSCYEYLNHKARFPEGKMPTFDFPHADAPVFGAFDLSHAHAWQKGDIVIADNRRMMHGRKPYEGEREVYVRMMR